ncbi:MAG: HD domain-containing protein [Candidatus Parcubacteria bacterium]|nr:HD domain-containing protein [Candidatus Parcubacteria bacterium]
MLKKIVDFLFELGHLRFTPRTGWQQLGIKDPQNDAEHTVRTAQIAFVLASMEGHKNPCHCATVALFHDIAEIRTGDMNKISKRYNQTDENLADSEQVANLGKVGENVTIVKKEFLEGKTYASKIAKDADRLELMFTAKELMKQGYPDAEQFFLSGFVGMETESAKQVAEELRDADPHAWWKAIKRQGE